eukprot:GHRR01032875.1.p5 GENE.GHRR01032875.1~~GHRR01032875.1.p5  ORF type:complete len:118 (+),score=35.22 GHRR01032875.1:1690-2043(+)
MEAVKFNSGYQPAGHIRNCVGLHAPPINKQVSAFGMLLLHLPWSWQLLQHFWAAVCVIVLIEVTVVNINACDGEVVIYNFFPFYTGQLCTQGAGSSAQAMQLSTTTTLAECNLLQSL